jgi:hypothetical protein
LQHFCSFERRPAKAALISFPPHRPAAFTSNRWSDSSTFGREYRMQRREIRIAGIIFRARKLSIDLGETPIARASSVRLSSTGSTLEVDVVALSGSWGFFFIVVAIFAISNHTRSFPDFVAGVSGAPLGEASPKSLFWAYLFPIRCK